MTMINKFKLLCTDIVYDITVETKLPLALYLAIELLSNLQILSLSLFPLLEDIPTSQNTLSAALNYTLSYLEPFKIFNPFDSEATVIITLTLSSLYFVLYLAMIGYIAFQRVNKNLIPEVILKTASFITLIHSKIIFYFIHCFVVRSMKRQDAFCSDPGSATCTAERIIIPAILFAFNTVITLCQEVFCYQIHQNKFAYGIKNNLHSFGKFAHKFLVITLFCIISDSAKILILFSVFFNIFDLLALHQRLPFFNLTMLKFSVACSTVSAFCSIVTIYRFFEAGENVCLFMVAILPLIIKMSLIKLNQTLRNIFSLKFKSPYHAVHLPNLIEDYLQKHAIFPLPDKLTKKTLYSMGFLGQEIERILFTVTSEQNFQITTQEIRKAAYSKALETMTRTLQRHPQSEVLLLSLGEIYYQVFGDSFKALDIVNKISEKKRSFAGKVSVKGISKDLTVIHQDLGQLGDKQKERKVSHLGYFAYRHKIQTLKKHMKLEIQDHLKLWKNFSHHEVDIFGAITQASSISSHTREITNYWYKNFEGQELSYVNASLIYGLYLEVVQAIPSGGSALIKKAYSSINNKWHAWRDVIDVAVGSSAVVVASIEPDKIGKVIDASSSVNELFKTTKERLLGTNIGLILPSFIAVKHNDYIRGYQRYFSGNIDHCINSYAKTLQDEYFKVEVTLHVSPMTHKGLNLVSYIRRLSEYQSMMIVDPKGNVVEYSKDLSLPLNLFVKKSHIKIESLCPDFKKINQAFAVLYQNTQKSDGALTTNRDEFEDNLLQFPKLKSTTNHLDSIVPPLSPANQRLLSNSYMENDLAYAFKSFRSEVPLSSNNDEPPMIHQDTIETPLTAAAATTKNNMPMISQEEAQEIWESYKDCKELVFYPYKTSKEVPEEVKYSAEIEPYFFDNKWYKVIKMKSASHLYRKRPTSHEMPQIYKPEEPLVLSVADDFADDFPSEGERTEMEGMTDSRRKRSSNTNRLTVKTVMYNKTQTLSVAKNSDSQTFVGEEDLNNGPAAPGAGQINMKKFSNKAQSVVSSQATHRMTAKRLNDSLKIERQSTSSKLLVSLVYLTVVAIVCSVFVHLISNQNSLSEMESSINLIKTVNARLSKTILNWQAMLILYSRAVKLRPIDWRIPKYQAVTISSSLDVITNAKQLAEQADSFKSKDLVYALYDKTVRLYEPFDHSLFDNHIIDQFAANSVLIEYYLWIARYNGSYLNLANNREFLFAINNTANDYLLTLDRSIDDLTSFFNEAKDSNIKLITGITIMEILLLLSPLALIMIIFFIIVRTYSKLFQAICRINENSLAKRVKQLEDLSSLFEGNLEDDVSSFHKFKSQGLTIKALNKKSASTSSSSSSRRYRIHGLVKHLSKYVLLAAALILVVIILAVVTLNSVVKDLENLNTINQKVLTVYNVGAYTRMLLPSYYVSIIFNNDTTYKIRNTAPEIQLQNQLDGLDNANMRLLSVLTDENNEITDPVIKHILNGNACDFVTDSNIVNCLLTSNGGAIGLLGLHVFYAQVCQTMKDWINAAHPTWTLGVSLSLQYSNINNQIHFVLFEIYDYLSNYLVGTFIEAAEYNKTEVKDTFYRNLAAVLVAMFLIRVIVLTRLQVFDLGIRRILRIIPYKIIEENKVMSCYLARTFQDELKVMKQIG